VWTSPLWPSKVARWSDPIPKLSSQVIGYDQPGRSVASSKWLVVTFGIRRANGLIVPLGGDLGLAMPD